MSPHDFEQWRNDLGLTPQGVVAALGISPEVLLDYVEGRAAVPTAVQLACAALAHNLSPSDWTPVLASTGRSLEARTNSFRVRLLQLFPDFAEFLDGSYYAREGGIFTPHGLCSEFSTYYLERIRDSTRPPVVSFFALVETVVAADPDDHDSLANAIKTCFLEDISSTKPGETARTMMGPATLRFFMGWHRTPEA